MSVARRRFLQLAGGAVAASTVARHAAALDYPTRPVRLIVGFAPAGATDILARLIGQWLSERLGQPFVIENRPGAGSNIGTEAVVRAPADGYTLLLVAPANAINATLYDKLNFNFIRDIAPVAGIIRVANVMVVNPSVPAKTVPEFIAYAKANPGKINMASAGNGSQQHVAGELFKMMAGVDMVHVPYRGGGARADRPARRAGAGLLRHHGVDHRVHQDRQAARAGGDHRDALSRCCRTSRPWANSCRATRRARGTASARPRARPPRSSTGSTGRSMPASPIPRSRRGSPIWAARRLPGSPAEFGKFIADETEKWGRVVKFSGAKPE